MCLKSNCNRNILLNEDLICTKSFQKNNNEWSEKAIQKGEKQNKWDVFVLHLFFCFFFCLQKLVFIISTIESLIIQFLKTFGALTVRHGRRKNGATVWVIDLTWCFNSFSLGAHDRSPLHIYVYIIYVCIAWVHQNAFFIWTVCQTSS